MMDRGNVFQIVVGVDGSRESWLALDWAIDEARLRRGRVRIVTGWELPTATVGLEVPAGGRDACERVAQRIQRRALSAVSVEGVEVTRDVQEGSASAVILEAADDADLLVVGSRGNGGFTRLLLGSVSNQVAHHARCPVLIVRPRPALRPSVQERRSAQERT